MRDVVLPATNCVSVIARARKRRHVYRHVVKVKRRDEGVRDEHVGYSGASTAAHVRAAGDVEVRLWFPFAGSRFVTVTTARLLEEQPGVPARLWQSCDVACRVHSCRRLEDGAPSSHQTREMQVRS